MPRFDRSAMVSWALLVAGIVLLQVLYSVAGSLWGETAQTVVLYAVGVPWFVLWMRFEQKRSDGREDPVETLLGIRKLEQLKELASMLSGEPPRSTTNVDR